jgi:hypothetical protein
MTKAHREMCLRLGFDEADIPPLRPTVGSRLAEIILRSVARAAGGSVELSCKGRELARGGSGKVSRGKVRALLRGGSGENLATGERRSVFGEQTGRTHGGLLFSRSPTRFFHEAPGMFRDIDLKGCYAQVMGAMALYAGQPVVYEPGNGRDRMTLAEAVAFVRKHAAGDDAWIIRASGKISAWPNVLIPSTRDALTNENYSSRAARRRAVGPQPFRYGLPFDRFAESRKGKGASCLFTDLVESGVVAHATWLMIQALPERWRREYEGLEVDSVLFYPRVLVADDGPGYDALVRQRRHDGTPWTASIDMEKLTHTIEWRLGPEHVALKFRIGDVLARPLHRLRQEAKADGDRPAEKGCKVMVNSLYGVTASPHLATNNVVAANVITATARALAFALQMSLNGVQVITDGCTYRRDQIPAGTLADCLAACPDYPINRAAFAGPFVDPAPVPDGDAFTAWYRGHVKRFFGVDGPDYDRLFGLHELEHKDCDGAGAAFDTLCCDGTANYLKLLRDGNGWRATDFMARSFGRHAKAALAEWLIRFTRPTVTRARRPLPNLPTC